MREPTFREERKVVTALFADLVGSTRIGERFDPEDAREIVSGGVALMIEAVERYGGTIKDLAGDGVLALFGAPVSHENDVERGVLAGLAIAGAMRGYAAGIARDWGYERLDARVGIETGLAVLGPVGAGGRVEYGAVGDVLNTAARLQSAARPGAVLVGVSAHREVADRFVWEPPIELALKGKGEPVVAAVALGPVDPHARDRVAHRAEPTFVGRADELATIDAALGELVAGDGSALLVLGEPGIGKTRLVEEGRRRALSGRYGASIAWLEGRCLSYAESVPYALFRDLLSGWLGIERGDDPAVVAAALHGDRARAAGADPADARYLELLLTGGGPVDAKDGEDAEDVRERVFSAAEATFVRAAGSRPLVLSLEDLHWADPTSLALTERMLSAVPSGPLLVLVTARPESGRPCMDVIEGAGERLGAKARTIALESLAAGDDEELFASLPGAEAVPDALRRTILETTEGNPFFLEEQVRSLVQAGRLVVGPDGSWRFEGEAAPDIPRTVERVLLARIDRLGPDEKDVLVAASVLGREFRPDMLPHLVRDDCDVRQILGSLDRVDLVRAERHGADVRFRFRHALIQEAAYRSLLKRTRRELHGRAAAAFEAAYAGRTEAVAEALGHHLLVAGEPERAVPYLIAAGDQARDAFGNEEALSWYGTALEALAAVTTGGPRTESWAATESDVHARRGRVLGIRGRYTEAREAYRRAIELVSANDPLLEATVRTEAAWIEDSDHRYAEALEQLDRAEAALGPVADATSDAAPADDERLDAWVEIQDARMSVYYWLEDLEAYAELIERVRPVLERRGSPEQRAGFYGTVLTYYLRRDRYVVSEEALATARTYLAAAEEVGHRAHAWAMFRLGFTLLWVGQLDEAAELLRASLREAERMGDATLRSRARTYLMVLERRRGHPRAVERAIEPVVEAAREASLPEYEAMALANRSWAYVQAARVAEGEADARAALELWRSLPVHYPFEWMALWPLIEIELGRGGVAEAIACARDLLGDRQQPVPADLRSQLERALEAWDAGDVERAEQGILHAVEQARRLAYL